MNEISTDNQLLQMLISANLFERCKTNRVTSVTRLDYFLKGFGDNIFTKVPQTYGDYWDYFGQLL